MTIKKKMMVGGILFAFCLLGVLIWGFGFNGFNWDWRAENRTETDLEALRQKVQKAADEGQFHFRISSMIVLENGDDEALLYIRNPEENSYDTQVEIFSEETGKTIYTSGVLKPGDGVEKDKLAVAPEMGEHLYIARFHILENKKEISRVDYTLSINRKN